MSKVRDIIAPQMTVLWFMWSRDLAEAYFQSVCHAAYGLAEFGERERHHPYSYKKAAAFVRLYF